MKYTQVHDGEWIEPVMTGWRARCCSCDLVHNIDFKIIGHSIKFRATRNNRATAAARRKKL